MVAVGVAVVVAVGVAVVVAVVVAVEVGVVVVSSNVARILSRSAVAERPTSEESK